MTSQPGWQTVAINILSSISWNKDNRAMIFSQLIDYNMENIFLEKSCTNVMKKLFPDSFLKNQNWTSFTQFVFVVCQVEGYQNILKLSCRLLAFTSHTKLFRKVKRDLELIFLAHFLHDFNEKYISCYIILTDQVSLSGCLSFVRYWTIFVL